MLDANWNVFRYLGDYLHLGGMVFGIVAVYSTQSVDGFSRKTQILFQMVYLSRYLDMFTEEQVFYLLFFKVAFNLLTVGMLLAFACWHNTYDRNADSCNIVAIVVPVVIATAITAAGSSFKEQMWTLSEFLEPFALLPQYIVCYRAQRMRPASVLYILAVGGYRALYVLNWIYKRYTWHGAYHDYVSWFGGGLECILFIDFVLRIGRREVFQNSFLGRILLAADDKAGKLSEMMELRSIGRRLPYGLSGGQDAEGAALDLRNWDKSDRLGDEEGAGLLTLNEDFDDF